MRKKYLFLLFLLFINSFLFAASTDKNRVLQNQLEKIDGLRFQVIEGDSTLFSEVYEIFLTQPLDHLNPENGFFEQRIFLSHAGFDKLTLIDTEGYAARNITKELTPILASNQIIVEHRYFGESVPDSLNWQYLNIRQAAADHHRVISLFKNIYKNKWVASGISKGGQTAIYHRRFYPDDVDVTVPYVSPLNLAREDPRIPIFISNTGSEECRKNILTFQKTVLKKRTKILELLKVHSKEKEYFFPMGFDLALEYNVLEYSFGFWQWANSDCDEIPSDDADPEELFDHLIEVSSFEYFSKKSIKTLSPFFYQAYTELGYYSYDTKPFKGLLKFIENEFATSVILAPDDVDLNFDKSVMEDVNDWVINYGNNMLYIYGEYDPWSASSVTIGENTNAVKMVKKKGSHRTRIKHFIGTEKEKIYSTLEDWLDVTLERNPLR